MSPETLTDTRRENLADNRTPLVRTHNLRRVLPGEVPVTLVDGISIDLDRRSCISVTGPSGSGKSSLLYLLGLLDRPTEGEIELDGEVTTEMDTIELARHRLAKIGFVFQFHFLLEEFTCLGNLMIPMRRLGRESERACEARAKDLLAALDMADQMTKHPSQLSGGQRQRVAVARALANDPPLLLADEPTGNLDSRNARNVFDILLRLAREDGRTVVVVTHDHDLAALADRQIKLLDGRVIGDGKP